MPWKTLCLVSTGLCLGSSVAFSVLPLLLFHISLRVVTLCGPPGVSGGGSTRGCRARPNVRVSSCAQRDWGSVTERLVRTSVTTLALLALKCGTDPPFFFKKNRPLGPADVAALWWVWLKPQGSQWRKVPQYESSQGPGATLFSLSLQTKRKLSYCLPLTRTGRIWSPFWKM